MAVNGTHERSEKQLWVEKTILSAKVQLGSLHMLQRQAQLGRKLFPSRHFESGKKKNQIKQRNTQ